MSIISDAAKGVGVFSTGKIQGGQKGEMDLVPPA
jgi:hypothetical protein